ncbi:ADI_G0018490.mRNA.1.CDS.1 [Saccharomyces cerevisiae]|uniref:Glucosamine 6-phosphate N-acetyltransferase n=2 Tax=Saccharomyces cerevisiae TaxID=4932 RepID=C7GY93_YEAS2|nr:Gna1p [Saccharomyces cerevisiae YJM993]AJP38485.1 Gna1p [Saccharomyces cerevisiae YJM1078]AJU35294.1 Gna1p [Saccharomyces cerevisiae YJM189]AJU35606.1 Gna1p [Saccharomyces cerevisiae YJM244]AJU36018.1 Gna1p [Saccharomyces cerevisiae YJM320]AJU36519.1 Gna1p [Saccharomyces cerevisiae YJM453]AJU36624.1 Gna1p [Saccharomyces cerevisiae YJM456]AJU36948.1 Gna1p [Saccharomyces cerevisiae YJM554]AJU37678.1 Gna1p [Saccharomyces cerevisiae YJM693]AJU37778.1 Gna1p [Saccharomyces cerevisiae YJM969]
MSLPDGFYIRRMEEGDLEQVTETLKVLTTVGTITPESFSKLIKYWNEATVWNDNEDKKIMQYNPMVIVDKRTETIAATGNIIIERKIIHELGLCGHIEDIAVNSKYQGQGLGKLLIGQLVTIGFDYGCYKIILDCDEKNVKFYEKCGFNNAGVEMQIRK